jgi:predicted transposase/invertase (TIGR01784 family)
MPDESAIDKKHQPLDDADLKITTSTDDSVPHKKETDSKQSRQKKKKQEKKQKQQKNKQPHRHDITFKLAMRDLRVAKEMIQTYLPLTATRSINLNTLAICPTSYIDQDHQHCHADILYSAKSVDDSDAYIYFIWEHQSTYDKQMPFRLLRYTCQIMHDHIKAGHDTLPIVIPTLLYNGKQSPYPGSCDLFDGFDNPSLARAQMFKPFNLLDLSVTTDKKLMQARWSALPNLILKHIHERDFLKAMQNTFPVIIRYLCEQGGEMIAEDMLQCIMRYTSASREQDFLEMIKETSTDAGDKLMTLYEKLTNLGRQEGIDLGRQEGIDLGRQEGIDLGVKKGIDLGRQEGIDLGVKKGIDLGKQQAKHDIIKNLLLDGMDVHRISKLLNIDCDDIEAIKLSLDH